VTIAAAPSTAGTALVVDDDRDMCRVLEIALVSDGYDATTTGSAQGAIALLAERPYPIVFVDARLPDMDGWQLIEELRRLRPETRIIMISGYYFEDDVRVAKALQTSEIDGFLAKPFRIEAVVAMAAGPDVDGNRRPIKSGSAARLSLTTPRRCCPSESLSC
jgi:DNA-binding NtrC family response regulator